ncbi:hypothetical protein CIPAW_15G057300 [Carya illinoinensis]|uniref:Uncharacterized protein n=1 Tax=Carya illinoinensis TaxID=32201 RepID=A0A8T1N4J7_CARIL|nr:hypothetical protein CIPAW_15G057300 [Carya illinoinensis]
MALETQNLHFVLLPHLSHGHLIPMADMAKLLAQHGVSVTIITTPINGARSKPVIDQATQSGLHIQLLQVQFPCSEVGLPEGCESMDALPSKDMLQNFLTGISMLQQPVEQLLIELKPSPSCIISDKYFAWTDRTARLPMITWPLFAEQFYNEKLAVQVLKIGVPVGAKFVVNWGLEEKHGVVVKREQVKIAIDQLMDEGDQVGQDRRKRARELGDMAKSAIEEGGSSYLSMKLLIQDIIEGLR